MTDQSANIVNVDPRVELLETRIANDAQIAGLRNRNLFLAQKLLEAQTALEASGLKIAELQQQLDAQLGAKTGKKPN